MNRRILKTIFIKKNHNDKTRGGPAESRAPEHYRNGSVRAYKYYRNHTLYKEDELDPLGQLVFTDQYSKPEPFAVENISEIRAGQFGR